MKTADLILRGQGETSSQPRMAYLSTFAKVAKDGSIRDYRKQKLQAGRWPVLRKQR